MSQESLIKEAESLSVKEWNQLLTAVALMDVPGKAGETMGVIADLIANPIKAPGFVPLSRDEANLR
jgi:hypothetical protein